MRTISLVATLALGAASTGALTRQPIPTRAAPSSADTLRAVAELVIGETSSRAHEFGFISGVTRDAAGRLYASDRMEAYVAVFAPDGRLVARIGRKGQGPGEFQAPTGVVFGPDGALYVRDMSRVSRFVAEQPGGVASRFERSFNGPPYADWMSTRRGRVDAAGRFHFPGYLFRDGAHPRRFYLRYAGDGSFVDTLPVPHYDNLTTGYATLRLSETGGRMVRGLDDVPFAPRPVWDVTPSGSLVSGAAKSYLLVETDQTGRTIRRFTRDVPPLRIAPAERRDSLRALEQRIDTLPIPIARLEGVSDAVRARRLPETYPPYTAVVAAEDGSVWVRRWAPAGRDTETFFDVFEGDGRFRATVVLPLRLESEPTPLITRDAVVGVVIDPDTDLQSLVALRVAARAR